MAFLALATASGVQAETPQVVVRAKLDPENGVVVGQPVRLLVDVLFPDAMPRPPRIGVSDAPGAQILRLETQGVTIGDRIDDRAYVGQRFEFVVFPRRGGVIDVPGADVTLLDASGDVIGAAKGDVQHVAVALPPGLDTSQPVIATTNLTVTQAWSPDSKQARLKIGDALVRTIRREASGMPAMGMADLVFAAPSGVRLYIDPPRSLDRINRGEVVGSRIDKVTYVFEKPGSYDLPELRQSWWDLASQEARTETLAGTHVAVVGGSTSAKARTAQDRPNASTLAVITLLVLGALAVVLLISRKSIATSVRRSRDARHASEIWAYKELCHIAPSGDACATYDALQVWLSRMPEAARQASKEDAPLARSTTALASSLFGREGNWLAADGETLKYRVIAFRSETAETPASIQNRALPSLNPPIVAAEANCCIPSRGSPRF
nr:BatD family protein [Methylobacterium brachythecii]